MEIAVVSRYLEGYSRSSLLAYHVGSDLSASSPNAVRDADVLVLRELKQSACIVWLVCGCVFL